MAARVLPLLEDGLRSPRSQGEGSSPQSKGSPLSKTRESRWAEAPTERLRPAHARRPSFLGELDAPARRPSLLGGRSPSKRSVDSLRHYQLGKVGKAENMWELERPKNAAERLLRKYMERNASDKKQAVSIASRLDVGEAARYAHVERPTTPYYGWMARRRRDGRRRVIRTRGALLWSSRGATTPPTLRTRRAFLIEDYRRTPTTSSPRGARSASRRHEAA